LASPYSVVDLARGTSAKTCPIVLSRIDPRRPGLHLTGLWWA